MSGVTQRIPTDEQKRQAIFDYLEQIRLGLRDPEPSKLKFLELEAKCLGMISGKIQEKKTDEDVNKWLELGDHT